MAGGEGTRLRPLTCDCPKPMIRLMNRPVLGYAIELLKRHGVSDIAVTLGYRPNAISDAFGDGGPLGVNHKYYVEKTPLGTAGGVRQASDFLDETFIVLSGDGVTDLDITRALAFHRERDALATLVLKRVENPLEYGVVDVDAEGRVRSFHEKPDWSEVVSDTVNTGIYILEPEALKTIPADQPCDFGRELFPRMLRKGLPLFGYVTRDYWCDVGDVRAYLGAHMDAMEGRVRLEGLCLPRGRAVQLPGAVVDRAAVLEGPCLIDAGARVCAGAYVGPYSVVGADCVIGEGASVKRSVLWPGARLEAGAQARGCVLAAGAVLGAGAQAYEESVLGAGASVAARGVVLSGVKLWPGKAVAEGERLDANRVWGAGGTPGFQSGTLSARDPAGAARAVQAWVAALKPREVLLGRSDAPGVSAMWHAAAAGAMALGVRVLDAGACALPMLSFAQRLCRADAALLLDARDITPLNRLGARLTGAEQRAVTLLNTRQDYPLPKPRVADDAVSAACLADAYVADVASAFEADPAACPPASLWCESPALLKIAGRAWDRAGLVWRASDSPDAPPVQGALMLQLDSSGEQVRLADACGALTEAQHQLMTAWLALEAGERRILLPAPATRGIDALAGDYRARVERLNGDRIRWMNALAEEAPVQFRLWSDGLWWAVRALSTLTQQGLSLAEWRVRMPGVHRRSRTLPLSAHQNGRVLRALADAMPDARVDGGLRLDREDRWAWIGAEDSRPILRIVAEGASAEFADELCAFCESACRRACADKPAE